MPIRAVKLAWTRQSCAFDVEAAVDAVLSAVEALLAHAWVVELGLALELGAVASLRVLAGEDILFALKIFVLLDWVKILSGKRIHPQPVFLFLHHFLSDELHALLVLDEERLHQVHFSRQPQEFCLESELVLGVVAPAAAYSFDHRPYFELPLFFANRFDLLVPWFGRGCPHALVFEVVHQHLVFLLLCVCS